MILHIIWRENLNCILLSAMWSELLGWLCFNYNDETVLQGETQYKYAEWQEQ